ncbi:hypothetical protein D3C77_472790 [compost metagenome]
MLLARSQRKLYFVGADRRPAAGHRVRRFAVHDGLRLVKAVVQADKRLAIRIEAVDAAIDGIKGIMISALAVFGFMINDRIFYFHFSRA